jgi:hypothetical protein
MSLVVWKAQRRTFAALAGGDPYPPPIDAAVKVRIQACLDLVFAVSRGTA